MAVPAHAQLHKKVWFEINSPYRLRMGKYVLPPDRYYLYQVSANDLNLFFLFKGDMRHTPIAAIRTVRVINSVRGYPDKTYVEWVMDRESSESAIPVVTGWEIPGEDGWEIIAVVPRYGGNGVLARSRY
jgi:hypothetical protein